MERLYMVPSVKYWDDWVDAKDMDAMWNDTEVCAEWAAAGEKQGQKVHMSRNSNGKPYVTQTEMRAMAKIVIRRHFDDKLDPLMICAIAEVESDRQPLAYRFEPKLGEASTGLMQTLQSTAEWLARDMGYTYYTRDFSSEMLYRPFVSVYFGGAFLKWLSTYQKKPQSEEFMVRSYNGGPKNASSTKTLVYWNKYLKAKQRLIDLSSMGYKAYSINAAEDLYRPFVSMYFAASYISWLSTFEGRKRDDQFIVKAYLLGPQNVYSQLAGPYWLRYQEVLTQYQQEEKSAIAWRNHGLCSVQ